MARLEERVREEGLAGLRRGGDAEPGLGDQGEGQRREEGGQLAQLPRVAAREHHPPHGRSSVCACSVSSAPMPCAARFSSASRAVRVCVERGSMPYSAVIQPWDLPRRNAGTVSSTLAVHSTWVSPHSIRTEPSAWRAWRRVKLTRRSSSTSRSEGRPMGGFLIPEPAERRRGGVVAGVAAALHGARAELEQLTAQLPGAAEPGGELGGGEGGPQSFGASR